MALAPGISTALIDIVGGGHVSFDLAVRRRHGCRLGDLFSLLPDAVVFPASTSEVSELMRGARACAVPLAHRSAARSLSGAMLLGAGGIVLSLERMNRIIDVDLADGIARIQPNVTATQLRSVAGFGNLEPTELSTDELDRELTSSSPILGVEAVLPTGEIVRTGGGLLARDLRVRESAALLAGPDGTLAVITELTVALDPWRAYPYVVVSSFPSVAAACAAARTVMMSERTPPRLSFLDRAAIRRVEEVARLGLRRDASAVLVFTGVDRSAECHERLRRIARTCVDAGALDSRVAEDPAWCAKLLRTLEHAGANGLDRALRPATKPPVTRDLVASEAWFGE